jgi:ParB family transcriptional regulator, chromosome partitioning protein
MPTKNLKGAMSKSRGTPANEQAFNGLIGQAETYRKELEKSAEALPVQEIEINLLEDNPFQYLARSAKDASMSDDSLNDLANSIKENGFYGALLARLKPDTTDHYQIAYGHRRREAARLAGLTALPVKVITLNDLAMARIMASENFSREDLTPLAEANVVGHLYKTQNLTEKEIATIVGKTRDWVALRMALQRSPTDVKAMIEQRPNTLGHVRLINQVEDEVLRTKLISQVLNKELTRNQLEKQLEQLKNKAKKAVAPVEGCVPYTSSENHHNLSEGKQATIDTQSIQNGESISLIEEEPVSQNAPNSYETLLLKLEDTSKLLTALFAEEGNLLPEHKARLEKVSVAINSLIRRREN